MLGWKMMGWARNLQGLAPPCTRLPAKAGNQGYHTLGDRTRPLMQTEPTILNFQETRSWSSQNLSFFICNVGQVTERAPGVCEGCV